MTSGEQPHHLSVVTWHCVELNRTRLRINAKNEMEKNPPFSFSIHLDARSASILQVLVLP